MVNYLKKYWYVAVGAIILVYLLTKSDKPTAKTGTEEKKDPAKEQLAEDFQVSHQQAAPDRSGSTVSSFQQEQEQFTYEVYKINENPGEEPLEQEYYVGLNGRPDVLTGTPLN